MSDHFITLIPEDPQFVPDADRQERARTRYREIAPESDEIELVVDATVKLHDAGENFERILCPACRAEIAMSWWTARLHDDYRDGFQMDLYETPCCGARLTLHQLEYDWPMGFGRFAIRALNPRIGRLSEAHKAEFEAILGTPLRVIYVHY